LPTAGVSYGARIHELALERPSQVALVYAAADASQDRQLTWTELDDRSTQLARALRRAGLRPGHRLAIKLRNSPEHVLAVAAGWKVGALVVPVRWDLPEWELDRLLGVLAPEHVVDAGSTDLFDRSSSESTDPLPDVTPPRAWGICSSGSTGSPKVITRDYPGRFDPTLSATSLAQSALDGPSPQLVLVPAPLYHTNGFMGLLTLLDGDPIVLMERFSAERMLGLVESHRVTGFVAATTMLQRLARVPGVTERDLTSVRWIQQGAAPIPAWLARFWIELVGPGRMFFCYGSTEGAGLVACTGSQWLEHPGTLGRGWNGTEIRILDHDTGADLPPYEVGEIYVRNPSSQVARYLGDVPQVPVTTDGFATVGDLGWQDADGWLYLADRRVDMIVTGGANVFPAEVESALSEHPDVADVVVIGLPDPEWGRRVHAVVEVRQGAAPLSARDLVHFARERLAAYKVPKTVEYVEAIPRTEALKVNRAALVAARDPRPPADGDLKDRKGRRRQSRLDAECKEGL
jgi:bile acid-coenzyme A ligase